MTRFGARRTRRARWVRVVVIGIPIFLAAWIGGLVWFADRIQPAPEPGGKTDAVVVLTGGAGRLDAGLELLSAGRAAKLFVSGVYHGVDVTALLKLSRTAPENIECCVVLGYAADSTIGNARETAAWMAKEKYHSLRLVTASYHMPRSLLEFHRAMPGIEIVPYPVFPERFKQNQWWLWPGTLSLLVTEYNKYLLAVVRGAFVPPGA